MDAAEEYAAHATAYRRRRFRYAAAVLAAGALGSAAMLTQVTDIGHATAFGGLAFGLLFAAGTMLYYGVRG